MIQYGDGQFGQVGLLPEMLEKFKDCLAHNIPVRALYVGTESELKAVKEEKTVKDQLEILKARVKALEPVATKHTVIPTKQEIMDFGKSI